MILCKKFTGYYGKGEQMKKAIVFLMVLTIFSKILGFFRDVTLSYFYGASNVSDAYLISLTIPVVIFSLISTGIATAYIPIYSSIENKYGSIRANKFTNNLINILIILTTIIIFIGILYTEQIVRLFASGFRGETLSLAIKFTKIALFGMYATGIMGIFTGLLQLKKRYFIPPLMGIPLNLIIVLSIVLSIYTNVFVLSIGTVLANVVQLIFLIFFVYKAGYRYEFFLNIKDKHIKEMALISIPTILGVSINQINILVDRTIASQITQGGISALEYANRLNGFVQGIIVLTVVNIMYPIISKMVANNNISGLKESVSKAISFINILVIPASMGAMVFAEPIVRFLFGRGAFDEQAVSLTSSALFFFSLGMIGFGLREVLSRAFYAMKDTKTPMMNATLAVIVNIILNIILSRLLGIGGLALATSISALFATFLLLINLQKKIGGLGLKNISITFIKIFIASFIMVMISKVIYNALLLSLNINLTLIITIFVSIMVYLPMIYLLKVEGIDTLINGIFQKIKSNS